MRLREGQGVSFGVMSATESTAKPKTVGGGRGVGVKKSQKKGGKKIFLCTNKASRTQSQEANKSSLTLS